MEETVGDREVKDCKRDRNKTHHKSEVKQTEQQ